MATGALALRMTDLAGEPLAGVTVDLEPVTGEPGTGGERLTVTLASKEADLTITGVTCREGPGTMYKVVARVKHFRPYAFFQLIKADRTNTASDDVEFWVKPGDVEDISAPPFAKLPPLARTLLDAATMIQLKNEDKDLLGLTGASLYAALGPLRQACFLNVAAKASHDETAGGCLAFVKSVMVCRQDRFFARVDQLLPERLRRSPVFKSAPENLHEALPGFQLAEGSFKTRDAHANLQVTFMREAATGALAADIDIDEASGIKHGMEVIRNAVVRNRTNPYLIREFLLAADPIKRALDPQYRFRF